MSAMLAEHLQKLGYPGGEDLGYQTFLYGTGKELRNVFLFLIDKIPKDREPQAVDATTGHHHRQQKICQKVILITYLFFGQLVPSAFSSSTPLPPIFPIVLFLSTTMLTVMTGMQCNDL
jgi:hypothetical protein